MNYQHPIECVFLNEILEIIYYTSLKDSYFLFWRLVSFFSGFLFLFGVLLYSSAIVYAYGMCSLFCFSFQWVAFNVVEI